MHILNLQAENVKRLVAVDITPTDNMVELTGGNGQGKTSVLDAIWWALAGKATHQGEPIRRGQDKGVIRLDLGELVVTREFNRRPVETPDGEPDQERITTKIKVETADGARYGSPQAMLDDLLGSLSFDPLKFARMSPREQYQMLTELLKLDFSKQESANQDDYLARKEHNRVAKDKSAAADAISVPDDTPDEPISLKNLLAELTRAEQVNNSIDKEVQRRERLRAEIDRDMQLAASTRQSAEELQERARRLLQQAEEQVDDATKREATLKKLDPISEKVDVAPIRARIEDSERVNRNVENARRKVTLGGEARDASHKATECTERIAARDQEIRKTIENADMPVPGLGLSDGVVTLNGIPLDQGSDAEQLRVSCAIAMRADAKLRVIRVRNGSALDDKSLAILTQMAKDNSATTAGQGASARG